MMFVVEFQRNKESGWGHSSKSKEPFCTGVTPSGELLGPMLKLFVLISTGSPIFAIMLFKLWCLLPKGIQSHGINMYIFLETWYCKKPGRIKVRNITSKL